MMRRNLLLAGVWAAGAFALTLAVLAPVSLQAVDNPDNNTPFLGSAAKMTAAGVEMSVAVPNHSASASTPMIIEPTAALPLQLLVKNTQNQSANVTVNLSVWCRPPVAPVSRTMPSLQSVFNQDVIVALGPGESRTIPLTATANLQLGASGMIQLQCGEQKISMLRFSVSSLFSAIPATELKL